MNCFNKLVIPVGVVVVLGLLILAAPRTVHAVAAALVQISNTASNPAVTQDIGQSASQMVSLTCEGAGNNLLSCAGGTPSQSSGTYTVPANRYLVITAVDVSSSNAYSALTPCSTPVIVQFAPEIGGQLNFKNSWTLSANAATTHFTYPPGFTVVPGATMQMNLSQSTANCIAEVNLYGYLTAN